MDLNRNLLLDFKNGNNSTRNLCLAGWLRIIKPSRASTRASAGRCPLAPSRLAARELAGA